MCHSGKRWKPWPICTLLFACDFNSIQSASKLRENSFPRTAPREGFGGLIVAPSSRTRAIISEDITGRGMLIPGSSEILSPRDRLKFRRIVIRIRTVDVVGICSQIGWTAHAIFHLCF